MKKKYSCMCLKPEKLYKYGFIDEGGKYNWYSQSGKQRICVWKKMPDRTPNKLIFPFGPPLLNYEVILLFSNMINDGVVEIREETEEEHIQKQIQELENRIAKLKERNN